MKKNKDKEDKRDRAIKIIKIVGSALGLTLCTAGFVALLTIGVRGCAHQSTANDIQLVKREKDKLSKRQLNLFEQSETYLNTQELQGYNNGYVASQMASLSSTGSYHAPCDFVFEYKGIEYSTYDYGVNYTRNDNLSILFTDQGGDTVFYVGFTYDDTIYKYDLDEFESDFIPFVNIYDFVGELRVTTSYLSNNWASELVNCFIKDYFTLESDLFNTTINFNSVINPFAPWGVNFDYFINLEVNGTKVLFNGLFYDIEGNYYNRISMTYLGAQGMRFGTANNYNTYQGNGSHYMTMMYHKVTGQTVTVNAQDYAIPTGGDQAGNGVTVMLKSNHWTSSIYQKITILTAESNSEIGSTFTPIARLSGLNNIYSDYSGVGEDVGVMGNVFTLLKGAFSAWLPILNIQVLPGIALGLFVFLPLVVMVVLFIVWLFKR